MSPLEITEIRLLNKYNNSQLCAKIVANAYGMLMPQTCECATSGSYCVNRSRLKSAGVKKISNILRFLTFFQPPRSPNLKKNRPLSYLYCYTYIRTLFKLFKKLSLKSNKYPVVPFFKKPWFEPFSKSLKRYLIVFKKY